MRDYDLIEPERRPTPNWTSGRRGRRPLGIVCHTTAGTFDGTCAWFANPSSEVSSHYLVGLDGALVQFVEEADTAQHAGRTRDPTSGLAAEGNPNLVTIGVEFEDGGDPEGVRRTDAQYRTGELLLGRIAARWGIPLDREHVVGHRELFAAKACPGNLDLDRLLEGARARPTLACLLPVRNAAADLPGYLDSVAGFADAVVALDDGSTDATRALLEDSPLVRELISNPPREGFGGWDDGANRRQLLRAAAGLDPDWALFLDVDERLDPEDAAALREFIDGDALRGCAYGLELHRAWGEEVAPGFTWVYRLFAWEPGLRLPDQRFHFNPVPESIPRRAWMRTTIRVRHLDSPARLEQRLAKYRQADRSAEREPGAERLLKVPDGPLQRWPKRAPELPALQPELTGASEVAAGAAVDRGGSEAGSGDRPKLVCLLPARNAEDDLPLHLESVAGFADAVVALDDGSTDSSRALLEADPLVERLLTNPRREGYAEWSDVDNRRRLLEAAEELRPEWVFFLDADELVDADDGAALRGFVERAADPRSAYGFRVFRMIGDTEHYDVAQYWTYRLFAFEPGLELPDQRHHLVPVPLSIPRERWLRTTVRIQHLAGLTEERRRQRYAKYEQADPGRVYQRSYRNLLDQPRELRRWARRPEGFPVLADPLGHGLKGEVDLEGLDPDAPVLSAIVISRNDEDRIERCVRSVVEQDCPEPFEVIVVVSGSDRTAAIVRDRFPQVKVIELEGEALPGRARNAGVDAARGDYISFPGSHVELPPGSLAARIAAHDRGWAMVTGTVLNGTPTRSGWASYFLDHCAVLPGRPSQPLRGAPAHCSYSRDALRDAGQFPDDIRTGEDTVVNNRLPGLGYRAYRAQEVRLVHASPCRGPLLLARHHFRRGRGLGRILVDAHRDGPRLLRRRALRSLLLLYVPRRLRRTRENVERWGGDLRDRYRRVRPLVLLGTLAAWAGLWFELLRPAGGKLGVLFAGQRLAPDSAAPQDVAALDRVRDEPVERLQAPAGVDLAELGERVGR